MDAALRERFDDQRRTDELRSAARDAALTALRGQSRREPRDLLTIRRCVFMLMASWQTLEPREREAVRLAKRWANECA